MSRIYYTKDKNEVIQKITQSSKKLSKLLKGKKGDFFMSSKYITHSDLYSGGKRTDKEDTYDENVLYYLTNQEMKDLSVIDNSDIDRSAKQSSIRVSTEFLNFINMKGSTGSVPANAKIFLVNDKLDFFNKINTELVINKLGKSKFQDEYIEPRKDFLIKIDSLHVVKHGIITSKDELLWKLRKSVFKGDILNIIVVKTYETIEIYLFFERNSVFYKITDKQKELFNKISITKEYLQYLRNRDTTTFDWIPKFSKKTRKYQEYWKKLLIDELIIYHKYDPNENKKVDYKVKCPISGIEISSTYANQIMIASHIKSFKDSSDTEVYDLNNGILMISHYDALFDKHLISINDENRIVFSSRLNKAALGRTLDKANGTKVYNEYIINKNRRKYLETHLIKMTEKDSNIA